MKNYTGIIIAVIIGLSIIGYALLNMYSKQLTEKNKTKDGNLRVVLIKACIDKAEEDYMLGWDRTCESLGENPDCSLDLDLAKNQDSRRNKDIENCYKLYK